jgi:hypothetical protein
MVLAAKEGKKLGNKGNKGEKGKKRSYIIMVAEECVFG